MPIETPAQHSFFDSQARKVYQKINFCQAGVLRFEVFATAYKGYLALQRSGHLSTDKPLLSICDFSLSANWKRLWIIDLDSKKVLYNTYVAHGQGTGEEYAQSFSNREGSHQSSIGFYKTGSTYEGQHGRSLYLDGLDKGYNCAARSRSIVIHGADYVSEHFIRAHERLGRSWGCPALAQYEAQDIIDLVKDGQCWFIYYPEKKYLSSCKWLKNDFNQDFRLKDSALKNDLANNQEQP